MQYPYLSDETIESAALQLLREVFPNEIRYPIDLDTVVYDCLCEKHGVVFRDEEDLRGDSADEVLGRMRPISNTIEVSSHVKADGHDGRYRFTVAHEIGHWTLHRPLFLGLRDQGDLFGTENHQARAPELISLQRNVFPSPEAKGETPREEIQANRFAVALLIDADVLRREFAARFGPDPLVVGSVDGHESLSLRDLARYAARVPDERGYALRDCFGLSSEAMAIALEARGYTLESPPAL
jgi:Zn-dependent peptidase ImmA (M78 family)